MELTEEQFENIRPLLPLPRGSLKYDARVAVNGMLHMMDQGCKWRALPARFGPWHTVYMRMYRWAKSGVLDHVFKELQRTGVIPAEVGQVSLDSTSVKVHPHGCGAQKKTARRASAGRAGG